MWSDPLVSAYTISLYSYIPIALVEEFIQDIPGLSNVRCSVDLRLHSSTWIFEFDRGTDPFRAMGLRPEFPYITLDHQNFKVERITSWVPRFENCEIVFDATSQSPSLSETSISPIPRRRFKFNNTKLTDAGSLNIICYICREEISSPFSTPCWRCKLPQCYDCLRQQLRAALSGSLAFPARCCSIFHPDVAKGILSHNEYLKYRLRVEEWLTRDQRIYCPIPTCSTFIPARLMRVKGDSDFECFECRTSICINCKQPSHIPQPCHQTTPQTDMLAVMQKFGYKQCPRCRTMVAKMFGCSHIRCVCGAHFCYDCGRRQAMCDIRPCAARDPDYYHVDDELYAEDPLSDIDTPYDTDQDTTNAEDEQEVTVDELPATSLSSLNSDKMPERDLTNTNEMNSSLDLREEDTNNLRQPASNEWVDNDTAMTETSPIGRNTTDLDPMSTIWRATLTKTEADLVHTNNRPTIGRSQTPLFAHADQNLDDPNAQNWEFQDTHFFGEEPDNRDDMDIWGCKHIFSSATQIDFPRYWKTASVPDWYERKMSERKFDCMICCHPTKVALTQEEIDDIEDDEERSKTKRDWRYARRCLLCNLLVCRRCRNDLVNDLREEREDKMSRDIQEGVEVTDSE